MFICCEESCETKQRIDIATDKAENIKERSCNKHYKLRNKKAAHKEILKGIERSKLKPD